ncbi:unnamed protein product [Gordionus sp. m RMFG-2023]
MLQQNIGTYPISLIIRDCPIEDLICRETGRKNIEEEFLLNDTVDTVLDNLKFISIVNEQNCYAWSASIYSTKQVRPLESDNTVFTQSSNSTIREISDLTLNILLKVWISYEEKLMISSWLEPSVVPVSKSKIMNEDLNKVPLLTEIFASKSFYPVLSNVDTFLNTEAPIKTLFEYKNGVFNLNISGIRYERIDASIQFMIHKATFGIYDCFIREAYYELPIYPIHPNVFKSKSDCQKFYTKPLTFHNPCSRGTGMVFLNNFLFTTKDNYLTLHKISCQIPGNPTEEIIFIQYIADGTVFFQTSKKNIWMYSDINGRYKRLHHPYKGVFEGIKTNDWCYKNNISKRSNQEIYAWDFNRVFMLDFYKLSPLKLMVDTDYTPFVTIFDILEHNYTSKSSKLISLFKAAHLIYLDFLIYDRKAGDFFMLRYDSSHNETLNMGIVLNLKGWLIINDSEELYTLSHDTTFLMGILYNANKAYIIKELEDSVEAFILYERKGIDNASSIVHILNDGSSQTLILLSNSSVIYIKDCDVSMKISFQIGYNSSQIFMLYFDYQLRLQINKFDIVYSKDYVINPKKRQLSLDMILYRAIYPQNECPFIMFRSDFANQIYYLDMGENLTLEATLYYLPQKIQEIDFQAIDKKYLKINIYKVVTTKIGALEAKKIINIQPSNLKGAAVIAVKPSKTALACPLVDHKAFVSFRCPPSRKLKIKLSYGILSKSCEQFKYIHIPRLKDDSLNDVYSEDSIFNYTEGYVKVEYLNLVYGCPWLYPYSKPLLPILSLYDGETLVKNLTQSNFVLIELNGRNDFVYNATMRDAGCVSPAPTIKEFMRKQKIGSGTKRTLLSMSINQKMLVKYFSQKDCFSPLISKQSNDSTDMGNLINNIAYDQDLNRERYEILNGTGVSSLLFQNTEFPVYVFGLYLIDEKASFCALNATFAVKIYGYLPGVHAPRHMLAIEFSCAALILLFSVYYLIFTGVKNNEIRLYKLELSLSNTQ